MPRRLDNGENNRRAGNYDCVLPPALDALRHLSSLSAAAVPRDAERLAHCAPLGWPYFLAGGRSSRGRCAAPSAQLADRVIKQIDPARVDQGQQIHIHVALGFTRRLVANAKFDETARAAIRPRDGRRNSHHAVALQ